MKQANITLNLIRPNQANPTITLYEALHAFFHFQSTPMAPKHLVHIKPHWQLPWGVHADAGFNIGPVLKHCQCYKIVMQNTNTV